MHSPEFDEERQVENLRREVASLGIRYSVVTDNDYQTWNAYHVEAWPTTFLLNKQGRIRWMQVGEGGYGEAEQIDSEVALREEHVVSSANSENIYHRLGRWSWAISIFFRPNKNRYRLRFVSHQGSCFCTATQSTVQEFYAGTRTLISRRW